MRRRYLPVGVFGAVLVTALIAWRAASARLVQDIPVAEPIVVTKAFTSRTDRLRRNETLTHMFARHNVDGVELLQLVAAARPHGLDPRRVTTTQRFTFRYVIGEEIPNQVRTRIDDDAFLQLDRDTLGEWTGELDTIEWEVVRERVSGVIGSSLNDAIHAAIPDSILPYGQRDRLIWNVAEDVYGWVIDFYRDLRPGDGFYLLYERLTSSAGDVRYGRLLAASIETIGRANTAYVVSDDANRNVYYDAEGRSLRRAFLRYPVQFRRISGGFGRRFHPILQRYRAHLGTDYAADPGTPIFATADGVVSRAGRWGGYGTVVTIDHPKAVETRYAHMVRVTRGIRPGVRVTQGQIIGYVGMTGLATGYHVHYEFLKNGRQVDSRSVDMGDGEPVSDDMRPLFEVTRAAYDRLLAEPSHRGVVAGS
ncbi:MAG: M23 family metallopeptidase [Gemmatimonadetes bacterium]|nr:M23 family metallopeptidase [Gemmatimonadota bacterium]